MRPDVGDDESPLIYGLEAPARTLAPGPSGSADSSLVRFCVGTQALRSENYVHVLEYLEENHSLSKQVFKHGDGEIWSLATSNNHGESIVSTYSVLSGNGKAVNKTSLWKFPVDLTNSITDEDIRGENFASLEKVCDFENDAKICRSAIWKPDEGDQLITFSEEKIFIWDVDSNSISREIDIQAATIPGLKTASRLTRTSTIRWSPHCNSNILGIVVGSHVLGIDLRISPGSSNPFVWNLNAHNVLTRDLDFNPNAQYYLATCGDDCESRFWDIRKPTSPALSFLNHSHWVWSIRYNVFHDQLVLSCSSDSRVVLTRVSSLASQPFGHLLDETSGEDEIPEMKRKSKETLPDGIIATFDEHEDSVYAAEWSSADPWIFASLSFDGRLVINKVPKREKMSILF